MIVIDKSDKKTLNAIDAAIKSVFESTNGKEKLGKSTLKTIRLPLRDGEEKDAEDLQDKMFFNCSSKRRPEIVGIDRQPILDESEIYSGMIGYVSINLFAYSQNKSKGIGVGLNNVMRTADGVRFGGGATTAASDFADIDVEDIL
jgi:hypothetical protein